MQPHSFVYVLPMAAFTYNSSVKRETIWLAKSKLHVLTHYVAFYRKKLPIFIINDYYISKLVGKKWYHCGINDTPKSMPGALLKTLVAFQLWKQ